MSCDPVLQIAQQIALTHHEHWDGGGYPLGLAGEWIPLAGRIVALADVYDALASTRPYKPAFASEQVLNLIADGVGKQFDPRVHAAFLAALPEIERLRSLLADETSAAGVECVPTEESETILGAVPCLS